MITRSELLAYLDQTLEPERFQDYCPNGLQVAGKESISTLVSGVTASEALIQAAIEYQADALFVHHGYFWRGEDQRIIGVKHRRLKLLMDHQINLFAYHLPLDAHPELGNNIQLAKQLGFEPTGTIVGTGKPDLALQGQLTAPLTLTQLADQIAQQLQRQPLVIQGHDRPVTRVGWCTGAAQGYIQQAAELGLDVFISGEISEPTVHLARELGINYIAAGHHATERYGAQAVGQKLAEVFQLRHHFIDIDNPV